MPKGKRRERRKGMYHSLTGKPSLRVGLVMGLLIGLCSLLLLAACEGENSAKGGAGGEHKKSTRSFAGTGSSAGLIAFRRYLDLEGTKSAIFTMYPNGSHIRQITHPAEGFSDDSPAWSPDGTKVAFNRREIDEISSHIMVLNTKTGDARQVSATILEGRVVRGMEGSDPAFSPEGKRLAFKRSEGIWIVGLDGSGLHQVTNKHPNRPLAFSDFGPGFSPDGKRLVFERVRLADDRSAVFVQPSDSSGSPEDARQITPWEMGCGDGPEFSPKGDWVLFSCEPEGDPSNLYWVHPDGTGLEQLTHTDADKHYWGSSFSPEFLGYIPGAGDYVPNDIVAARYPAYGDEGNSDVFRMHIEGGVVPSVTVNLTKSATLDDDPSWGTHPPSLKSLYKRGCDPVPKEPEEASKC
jgi:dipeptidyl aminopeptidase/acylaminoacyl peptidase